MNRILIVIPDISNPGGIANYFRTLTLDQSENIDYHYLNNKNNRRNIILLLKSYVSFLLKVKRYEVIHLNPPLSKIPFWRELPYLIISKIFGKKVIVFFHGGENA